MHKVCKGCAYDVLHQVRIMVCLDGGAEGGCALCIFLGCGNECHNILSKCAVEVDQMGFAFATLLSASVVGLKVGRWEGWKDEMLWDVDRA